MIDKKAVIWLVVIVVAIIVVVMIITNSKSPAYAPTDGDAVTNVDDSSVSADSFLDNLKDKIPTTQTKKTDEIIAQLKNIALGGGE
jgi:hypothetical protein